MQGKTNTAIITANAQSSSGSASDQEQVTQKIFNAYDPNDILVFDVQDTTLAAGVTLHYLIRFQNTGNDTAFNIIVEDSLPIASLDLETLNMLGASHTYFVELDPNGRALFTFPNIMLPDSGANYIGSNGFVAFSVKLKDSLTPLTEVVNRAGIFFDFNPAVITNDAIVRISTLPGIEETENQEKTLLYPNPVGTTLFIINETHHFIRYNIRNTIGQTIMEGTTKGNNMDVSSLATGIYLLQINKGNGEVMTMKFIKD